MRWPSSHTQGLVLAHDDAFDCMSPHWLHVATSGDGPTDRFSCCLDSTDTQPPCPTVRRSGTPYFPAHVSPHSRLLRLRTDRRGGLCPSRLLAAFAPARKTAAERAPRPAPTTVAGRAPGSFARHDIGALPGGQRHRPIRLRSRDD